MNDVSHVGVIRKFRWAAKRSPGLWKGASFSVAFLVIGLGLAFFESSGRVERQVTLQRLRIPAKGPSAWLDVRTATGSEEMVLDAGRTRIADLRPGDSLVVVGKVSGRFFHVAELRKDGRVIVALGETLRTRRIQAAAACGMGLVVLTICFARVEFLWRRRHSKPDPHRHSTTVYCDAPEYWVHCNCGWTMDDLASRDIAVDEARKHSPQCRPEIVDSDEELASSLGFVLVSRDVVDDGKPILVMFREAVPDPADSGWRAYSGYESEAELEQAERQVGVDVERLLALDPTVEPILTTKAPCAFERKSPDAAFARVPFRFDPAWLLP